ncbi:MAG TPA: hypothetical protein VNA16_11505 [Abditibacteriaceae bacterium]|nr:hypothetical protein [Abditibacteriaceae bacterium]
MKLRSFILLLGILWAVSGTALSGTARADEFSVVAASDPMYAQLAAITKAGWLSASPVVTSKTNAPLLLTRYEIALETAKAIFMVTARNRADSTWAATAPRPALRALREMTAALRVELKKLDVDAASTLTLFDGLLKLSPAVSSDAPPLTMGTGARHSGAPPLSNRISDRMPDSSPSGLLNNLNLATRNVSTRTSMAEIPLSQRLRLTTTLLALARDADNPGEGPAVSSPIPYPTIQHLNPGAVSAGAELDVTDWLSLRAEYHRRLLAPNSFSSRVDPFGSLSENRLGGGVDIALPRGLTVSGNLARVTADTNSLRGMRLEGGLGFTAWQDRLSLTANLSRLMPEDSTALSSTAAGLNVDVDVTERLSLSLLYKQLFGPQNPTRTERFVGGGISINF